MSQGEEPASPPAVDVDSGLLAYSTRGGRRAGRLRSRFDDFQVTEMISLGELSKERAPGLVPVYQLRKAGIDTPHAAREISAAIRSEVNFAGLKDKSADVVQYVSARSSRASSPAEIVGDRFSARLVGFSSPVTRRMLLGNRFRILVQTSQEIGDDLERCFDACRRRRLANFFGYQRFGLKGGVNRRVGKAIVSRDFALAVRLVTSEPREGEVEGVIEARRLCSEERYAEAAPLFTPLQDSERRIAVHLSGKPADHIGALRRMQIAIRRLVVNSYQSYLFNLTLSRALSEGLDISSAVDGDNWAPLEGDGLLVGKIHGVREETKRGEVCIPLVQLVGYAYRDYGSRFDAILREVIKEEGISPGSFYVKEAEEMSSEGGFRAAPLLAKDLSWERGERGFRVEFALGKGEYATVLIREVLKPDNPRLDGF